MGFAKAKYILEGSIAVKKGEALVDTGAWYTIVDEALAESVGVDYTGLTMELTTFSGHRVTCREAIVRSITLKEKKAPSELVAVCSIPDSVKEPLKKQEVSDRLVVGVHTLERLGYAVDPITHELVKSPGVLAIWSTVLTAIANSRS